MAVGVGGGDEASADPPDPRYHGTQIFPDLLDRMRGMQAAIGGQR
jgi:hypothetical protein